MSTPDLFRKLALSLPNTIESSHMGHPDFRVFCPDKKLRIFATLSGEAIGRGVISLTLDQQAAFIGEMPEVFEPCKGGWGRMGMTYVHLDAIEEDTLLGALSTAHRNVLAKAASLKSKRLAAKPGPGKEAGAPSMRSSRMGGSVADRPSTAAKPRIKK